MAVVSIRVGVDRRNHAKIEFKSWLKALSLSRRTTALVTTLLPPNVLRLLREQTTPSPSPGGREDSGRLVELEKEIDGDALVLFCRLPPLRTLGTAQEAFCLLNEIFAEFDDQVTRFHFFKYHHIFETYIVCSPSAALAPSPHASSAHETRQMLLLAENLQQIAARYVDACGAPLFLHCGMAAGPLVGKMVGKTKSFWCLFGNPINLAARLAGVASGTCAKSRSHDKLNELENEADAGQAGGETFDAAPVHAGIVCSSNVLKRLESSAAEGAEAAARDGSHGVLARCQTNASVCGVKGGTVGDSAQSTVAHRSGADEVEDIGDWAIKGKGTMRLYRVRSPAAGHHARGGGSGRAKERGKRAPDVGGLRKRRGKVTPQETENPGLSAVNARIAAARDALQAHGEERRDPAGSVSTVGSNKGKGSKGGGRPEGGGVERGEASGDLSSSASAAQRSPAVTPSTKAEILLARNSLATLASQNALQEEDWFRINRTWLHFLRQEQQVFGGLATDTQ